MAVIANLDIIFGSRTQKAERGIKRVGNSVTSLGGSFTKMAVGVAAGIASFRTAEAFLGRINDQFDRLDEFAKRSDRLGVAPEQLQRLAAAASLAAGANEKELSISLQRMTRRISEAANAGGGLNSFLSELGLNAQELNRLSPDQQFLRVADAIAAIPNNNDKVRATFKLFDSEGVKLVNLLRLGSEGIQQQSQFLEELGLLVDRFDLGRIEAANDTWTRLDILTDSIYKQMAINLAPAVERAGDLFFESAEKADRFKKALDAISLSVETLANLLNSQLEDAFAAFEVAADIAASVGDLGESVGLDREITIRSAINAIAGPLGPGIGQDIGDALLQALDDRELEAAAAAGSIEAESGSNIAAAARQLNLGSAIRGSQAEFSTLFSRRSDENNTDQQILQATQQGNEILSRIESSVTDNRLPERGGTGPFRFGVAIGQGIRAARGLN